MTEWRRVKTEVEIVPCEAKEHYPAFECALCKKPCDTAIVCPSQDLSRKFVVGCHEDARGVRLSHVTLGLNEQLTITLFDEREQPSGVTVG